MKRRSAVRKDRGYASPMRASPIVTQSSGTARGHYYVVDLKSAEGTFLNGRRIRRTQALKHGDTVRFGGATPYRFIDPDALKRRRWRRILRLSPVVAVLVAVGLADHFEKWGLLSATLTEIAALAHPQAKPVEAPTIVAASAPTQRSAPTAQATSMPGPAAYVANVAPTAQPLAASTRRLPVPASTARTPSPRKFPIAASTAPPLAASAPKSTVSAPTSNVSASSSMTWLERINFYRAGMGLDAIRDDPTLSAGAAAHAHYLHAQFRRRHTNLKTDEWRRVRREAPAKAATRPTAPRQRQTSSWRGVAAPTTPRSRSIIGSKDRFIASRCSILSWRRPASARPRATDAGSPHCDCRSRAEEVKPYARAIEFPPDGSAIALDWIGIESPDPLASCSGYERPVGLPITLQIGRLVDTKLSAHSLTEDGKPIEYCAFDAPSYRNPNATGQEYGRWNLRASGAVVIVPRAPLQPGSHYAVSITANDTTYAWSFTAAGAQLRRLPRSRSFRRRRPLRWKRQRRDHVELPGPIARLPDRKLRRARRKDTWLRDRRRRQRRKSLPLPSAQAQIGSPS